LSWGQYFFLEILRDGVLLFDSGESQFVAPKVLTPQEEKQKAQDYFDIWFSRSQGFIHLPSVSLEKGDLKIGAFTLHQATESLYFAVLLVFTGYKPRVHNLWKLRKKTKAYSDELFLVFRTETDKQEEHLFDLLKRGYIDARYKQDYIITEEELSTLINRVKEMMPIVERICRLKIASY